MTAAEQKAKEVRAKVSKVRSKIQKSERECQTALESLNKSSHPVAATMKTALSDKLKQMQAMEKAIKAAETKGDVSKKADADLDKASQIAESIDKDIMLSKKL